MDECTLYSDPVLYDQIFPNARGRWSLRDEARRQRMVSCEDFYVSEAKRSSGPVLELGCGTGRLTVPIAQNGVNVLGLDLSGSMLDIARKKAAAAGVQVRFVQGDMRKFELPVRFDAILVPGNSLLHLLSNSDLKECLGCVRDHLANVGRLAFDVSLWNPNQFGSDPLQRHQTFRLQDPQRGEITIEETEFYNAEHQTLDVVWYLSDSEVTDFKILRYRLRVIYPQELLLLLESVGLQLEERHGEFTREPFQSTSPRQVCICSRRG